MSHLPDPSTLDDKTLSRWDDATCCRHMIEVNYLSDMIKTLNNCGDSDLLAFSDAVDKEIEDRANKKLALQLADISEHTAAIPPSKRTLMDRQKLRAARLVRLLCLNSPDVIINKDIEMLAVGAGLMKRREEV